MKINKKLMTLIMTLAVGGALVGCGSKAPAPETTTPPAVETPADKPEEGNTEETPVEGEEGVGVEEAPVEEGTQDPSALAELFFTITNEIELPTQDEMMPEMFADAYGIDTSLLEDYYVSVSMMNVHATEFAIFEVKDEASIDAVKAGIEKRQKALEEQWKSYLPDQYELVQNAQTIVKGNKILFVINENADKVVENFLNNLAE